MERSYNRSYFFDQGIHFECQRCGACCTGDPGIIYVDIDEVTRIAEYLSDGIPSFTDKYLFPLRAGYSIKEHSDGRCFFYNNGCTIYPVRPHQCKTYPFWFENLRSNKKWKRVLRECPGIGSGPLYPREKILEIVQSTMDAVVKSYLGDNEKPISSMEHFHSIGEI
jgi:Fe-S-cluster containining protein